MFCAICCYRNFSVSRRSFYEILRSSVCKMSGYNPQRGYNSYHGGGGEDKEYFPRGRGRGTRGRANFGRHHRGGRGYGGNYREQGSNNAGYGRGRKLRDNYGAEGFSGQEEKHPAHLRGSEIGMWYANHSRKDHGSKERPPPGLKGKEIGLWYARRQTGRNKEKDRLERPMITLNKSDERKLSDLVELMDAAFETSKHFQELQFQKAHKKKEQKLILNEERYPAQNESGSQFKLEPKTEPDFGRQIGLNAESFLNEYTNFGASSASTSKAEGHRTFPKKRQIKLEESQDEEDSMSEDMEENGTMFSGNLETEPQPEVNVDDMMVDYLVAEEGLESGVTEDPFFRSDKLQYRSAVEQSLHNEWEKKQSCPRFQAMLRVREQLPMTNSRDDFYRLLHNNQVCVISGETGCGKSTQVPQMILEDALDNGTASSTYIVVTQPRRISAISLAERVKEERAESSLGQSVGYQIRLEAKRPREGGGILYCTTGILLRWLLGDKELKRASHIVLDEIHERDISSDFLLIIIRDLLTTRKDLKVVLMSATLNAKMFSDYFNGAPILEVPGRLHKVTPHFLEEILHETPYRPEPLSGRRKIPMSIMNQHLMSREKQAMAEALWAEMSKYANSLIGKYQPEVLDFLRYEYDEDKIDFNLILELTRSIVTETPTDEAILIFLPGWMDISKLLRMFKEQDGPFRDEARYWIVPLHSLLPSLDQRKVFERPKNGCRKIVIATNIAETSITVEDVVHVIDCGKIKMTTFDVESNIKTLSAQWVSDANAEQRRGRAGRVREGHCYHLFTKWRYDKLNSFILPEMKRTRLDNLCLQIKLMGMGDVYRFLEKAPEPPSMESLQLAVKELFALGALDEDQELTPLGMHIARLPVDPHCGKMIVFGAMFGCLDPILTIAACLDYKDPFHTPMFKEKEVDRAKKDILKDFEVNSDHLLWVETFKQYYDLKYDQGNNRLAESWARSHFLNLGTMKLIEKMKGQFSQMLKDLGFLFNASYSIEANPEANRNSLNYGVVAAVVCAGLYPRVAESGPAVKRVLKYRNKCLDRIYAHPKSVNAATGRIVTRFVAYHQLIRSTKLFLNDCGMVSPYSLILFGGNLKFTKDGADELITLDDWIKFHCSINTARIFQSIRRELDAVLERRVNNPCPVGFGAGLRNDKGRLEERFVETIVECLTNEEVTFHKDYKETQRQNSDTNSKE